MGRWQKPVVILTGSWIFGACTLLVDTNGLAPPGGSTNTADGGGNDGSRVDGQPGSDGANSSDGALCGALKGECCSDNTCQPGLVCAAARCTCLKSVAAGGTNSCAVYGDGSLWCWGSNEFAQLTATIPNCNSGKSCSPNPVKIRDASGVADIAIGTAHMCLLKESGAVACWGDNTFGQLGLGDVGAQVFSPIEIPGLIAQSLAVGAQHSCALLKNGEVNCWGSNDLLQVGVGSSDSSLADCPSGKCALHPTKVTISGVTQIAAGDNFTCVLLQSGVVQCWGQNNNAQLGTTTSYVSAAPLTVNGFQGTVTHIAAGSEHACALVSSGSVRCWGRNSSGQLGRVRGAAPTGCDSDCSATPVQVAAPSGMGEVRALALGAIHSCAATAGGVWCWGNGADGQLGFELPGDSAIPVRAGTLSSASQVAAGRFHTCANVDAHAFCWGQNTSGQVGSGTTSPSVLSPAEPNLVCE